MRSLSFGTTVGGFVPYGPGGPSHAWLVVGGEKRSGARTRFITENHIWSGEFGILTAGIRFGGGRLSADIGAGITVPSPAVPFPVLNVSHRF